ncbi:flagellar motor protein MotD [Solimonas soli]|uniref:flagellar motor protein MotD n=1 Tax=Solimonas soli TaxID=413479 RepID=UPI0004B7A2F9|nr:flagellar motor protein MotD [Solimonas soli]
MAKKRKHEEHVNHEAWAIPYGDLLTLLLAFFVVMYAVSSVNEGRYRVLADSLSQAFGGPPKSLRPIQLGERPQKGTRADAVFFTPDMRGFEQDPARLQEDRSGTRVGGHEADGGAPQAAAAPALQRMADAVQSAMQDLIRQNQVIVRRNTHSLEIEIRADILFASGVSQLAPQAAPVLRRLAGALREFPNALRIEGHTDNVPIATSVFPSNWELSAARAASVVHLFMESGVAPTRMSVAGFGEYRPIADNATAEGRNRNRRVLIVVMAEGAAPPAPLRVDAAPEPAAAAPSSAAAP